MKSIYVIGSGPSANLLPEQIEAEPEHIIVVNAAVSLPSVPKGAKCYLSDPAAILRDGPKAESRGIEVVGPDPDLVTDTIRWPLPTRSGPPVNSRQSGCNAVEWALRHLSEPGDEIVMYGLDGYPLFDDGGPSRFNGDPMHPGHKGRTFKHIWPFMQRLVETWPDRSFRYGDWPNYHPLGQNVRMPDTQAPALLPVPHVHMIWLDGNAPSEVVEGFDEWTYAGYEVQLWTEVPKAVPTWLRHRIKGSGSWRQATDLLRYWLLATFGGWYVDTDVWPYGGRDCLPDPAEAWANQSIECGIEDLVLGAPPRSGVFGYVLRNVEAMKHNPADSGQYGANLLNRIQSNTTNLFATPNSKIDVSYRHLDLHSDCSPFDVTIVASGPTTVRDVEALEGRGRVDAVIVCDGAVSAMLESDPPPAIWLVTDSALFSEFEGKARYFAECGMATIVFCSVYPPPDGMENVYLLEPDKGDYDPSGERYAMCGSAVGYALQVAARMAPKPWRIVVLGDEDAQADPIVQRVVDLHPEIAFDWYSKRAPDGEHVVRRHATQDPVSYWWDYYDILISPRDDGLLHAVRYGSGPIEGVVGLTVKSVDTLLRALDDEGRLS